MTAIPSFAMHRAICLGAVVLLNKGVFTETAAQQQDRQQLIAEIVALDTVIADALHTDAWAATKLAAYTAWEKMAERVRQALTERGLKISQTTDSIRPSRPRKHKPKTR